MVGSIPPPATINMSEYKKSYCLMCLSHCRTLVKSTEDTVLSVKSDFTDPVSQGYTCEMMQVLIDVFNSNQDKRIKTPLKKVNGSFVEISWEQTISEISDKLLSLTNNNQGNKIFYMYDDLFQQITAEYSFKFFSALGVTYYYNILSWEKIVQLLANSSILGVREAEPDSENSDVLMIVGKNAWVTHHTSPRMRIQLKELKNNPNKSLIVVDPVKTETAKMADIHIQLKPGTDAWFMLALSKYMADQNLLDTDIINTSLGAVDLVNEIKNINIDHYLDICGISIDQIKEIAALIYKAKGFSILTELGINHSINQFKSMYYCIMLQVLTGNFNRLGGLVQQINFLTSDYALPNRRPGITPFTNEPVFNGTIPTPALADNLFLSDEEKFEALVFACYAFDPSSHAPNKKNVQEAITKIPFKIGIASVWNETVELMDYILPTYDPYLGETNLSPTKWQNTIKMNEPIFSMPTGAKKIEDIVDLLSDSMLLNRDYRNKLAKFKKLFNNDLQDYFKQLSYEPHYIRLKLCKDIIGPQFNWPWLGAVWLKLMNARTDRMSSDQVISLLHDLEKDMHVKIPEFLPTAKINFTQPGLSVLELDETQLINKGYPFILGCGFRQRKMLNNVAGHGAHWLEIHPDDAEKLNLTNNSPVKVTTPIGSLDTTCKIAEWMQPGYVRLPNFKNINLLTDPGKVGERELNPRYKFQFAKIEKI